jgi:hypothetical protein
MVFCRDCVAAAEPDVHEMVAHLRAPLPVTARGIAGASVLLTDGTGPCTTGTTTPGSATRCAW